MSLPNDRKINKAIRQINQKYKDAPEYQITNVTVSFVGKNITIACRGPHHVANAYDLGLALGGGWFGPTTEHESLPDGGSLVRFSER